MEISATAAVGLAGLMLAESGADVLQVRIQERTHRVGDVEMAVVERSKRQLSLSWEDAAAMQSLHELLQQADLLLHDLSDADAKRLGLPTEHLSTRFKQLIVIGLGALPSGHTDTQLPAVDSAVLAYAGLMNYIQPATRPDGPVFLRFPLATQTSAYLLAVGAVARLVQRATSGVVASASTSLLQGALIPTQMLCQRAQTPSPGLTSPPKALINQLLQCSDGEWLHLMSPADHVPSVQERISRMAASEVKALQAALPPYMQHIPNFLVYQTFFKALTSDEWLKDLWAHDVAVDRAEPLGTLFLQPQVADNQFVVRVDDPLLGPTLQPGMPFRTQPPARVRAPRQAGQPGWLSETRHPWPQRDAALVEPASAPLAGIKVVDLGSFLAGPLATQLMAELGANVIKVEALSGDPMRWAEWAFCSAQVGKQSIAIDLKNAGSRPILQRLVETADVVHHNLRMPAALKLGLGYDELVKIKPDLIYCHVNAYGAQGARATWPGFDQMMQSAAGWERECAGEGNAPMWIRFGMTDHLCALSSLLATVLALFQRARTGEGQQVSASLLGATMLSLAEHLVRPDGSAFDDQHLNHDQTGISASHRLYRCVDGWALLHAQRSSDWHGLLRSLDLPSEDAFVQLAAQRQLAEMAAIAARHGVTWVPVRSGEASALLDDDQLRSLGLIHRFAHPVYGWLEMPVKFWTLPGVPYDIDVAAPTLGQHTDSILLSSGFEAAQIQSFHEQQLVRQTRQMSI